jgi:hypothetical protein
VLYGGGLVATPNANLVQNIGFDSAGTHTKSADDGCAYDLTSLGRMVHPSGIKTDHEADSFYFQKFFAGRYSIWQRLLRTFKRNLSMMRWNTNAKPA